MLRTFRRIKFRFVFFIHEQLELHFSLSSMNVILHFRKLCLQSIFWWFQWTGQPWKPPLCRLNRQNPSRIADLVMLAVGVTFPIFILVWLRKTDIGFKMMTAATRFPGKGSLWLIFWWLQWTGQPQEPPVCRVNRQNRPRIADFTVACWTFFSRDLAWRSGGGGIPTRTDEFPTCRHCWYFLRRHQNPASKSCLFSFSFQSVLHAITAAAATACSFPKKILLAKYWYTQIFFSLSFFFFFSKEWRFWAQLYWFCIDLYWKFGTKGESVDYQYLAPQGLVIAKYTSLVGKDGHHSWLRHSWCVFCNTSPLRGEVLL